MPAAIPTEGSWGENWTRVIAGGLVVASGSVAGEPPDVEFAVVAMVDAGSAEVAVIGLGSVVVLVAPAGPLRASLCRRLGFRFCVVRL